MRWPGGSSGWRRSARCRASSCSAPQLQRDMFQRGDPEPIADIKHPQWTATLYDLLSAYAKQRQQAAFSHVQFKKRNVWALQEAREVLERLVGQAGDWAPLDKYLIEYLVEPSMRATVFASSLAATLELVREGHDGGASAVGILADLPA